MIIQSKTTDATHEIDIETWEKMKKNDMARRFKVISTLEYEPSKAVPVEVENFMEDRPEVTVKKVYEEAKEEAKEELEELAEMTEEKPKKPRKKKVEQKTDNNE